MQKTVAVLLMALLAAPARAFAQDAPIDSVRYRTMGQTTAHILSPDLLRKAAFREASRLADTLAPASLQQQSRQWGWAGRHPVLLGVLVGAGIGVAAAAIKCDAEAGSGERDQCRAGYWTLGPFLGGAIGFIISLRR